MKKYKITGMIWGWTKQYLFSLKTFFNTPRIINKDDEKEVFEYVTLSAKKAARISSLIAKHCGLIEIPTEPSIAQKLTYDKEHIGALFVKAEAIEKITISDPETYKPLDLTIGTYFNLNLSKAHNIYVTLKEANPKMLFPLTSSFKTKEERDTALDTFISTLNKTNEPKQISLNIEKWSYIIFLNALKSFKIRLLLSGSNSYLIKFIY